MSVFAEFRERVGATVEAHGGRYLVRGGATEVADGDWTPDRLVVIEFDSVEQARAWVNSPEYTEIKGHSLKVCQRQRNNRRGCVIWSRCIDCVGRGIAWNASITSESSFLTTTHLIQLFKGSDEFRAVADLPARQRRSSSISSGVDAPTRIVDSSRLATR